ncbi:sigma-70 family RNA polymerase sigma factor [Fulvivirgaceae bacterium BMA12]|uniref:Sigma-70 family RNA polymerase sigma factor n=1 Tax=Agaribacillus aureus TaxID=3051825 RepID=A0ABT8LCI7_9BACT|nr:sigma-70 family RNA polymerase sigma factor [Fulvivirgaceae bacterium BMA12]
MNRPKKSSGITKQASGVKLPHDCIDWGKFRNGDQNAFARIFKQYNPILYHHGVRFFYDPEVVEDCIQDLFLGLWRNRKNLSEVESVKYYLIVSLRRILLRNKVITRRQAMIKEILLADTLPPIVSFSDEQASENELKTGRENLLNTALDRLPPRQKQALSLKYFQQKSYVEITSIMSINYQTARKFVYKAIQNLRKNMRA